MLVSGGYGLSLEGILVTTGCNLLCVGSTPRQLLPWVGRVAVAALAFPAPQAAVLVGLLGYE